MKRLIVGLLTLVLVFAGVWWSLTERTGRIQQLLGVADAIEAAYAEGQQQECLRLCGQFYETVEKQTAYFFLFTTHEELHALQETDRKSVV